MYWLITFCMRSFYFIDNSSQFNKTLKESEIHPEVSKWVTMLQIQLSYVLSNCLFEVYVNSITFSSLWPVITSSLVKYKLSQHWATYNLSKYWVNLAKLGDGLNESPTIRVGNEKQTKKCGKKRDILKPSWDFIELKN